MTAAENADKACVMKKVGLLVKVLVFAAYALAMLVPGLTVVGKQTPAEHARMMVSAGHEMAMPDMGSSGTDEAKMLFCQQHCLVAVATLPAADQAVEIDRHLVAVEVGNTPLVSSLVFPPPGHPPKIAVI